MIKKRILNSNRIRRIHKGFSFIPHRFLLDGFLASLNQKELLLYLFLVLVSDRYGLSCYNDDSICSLLQITADQYVKARNGLMEKDLIAFDGTVFQVLDLPAEPIRSVIDSAHECGDQSKNPAHIATLLQQTLKHI